MSERAKRTAGIIPPDQRDIIEVNSLDSKQSRWSRFGSSRVVRAVGATFAFSAVASAAAIAAEAAQSTPPAVVRNVEQQEDLIIPRNLISSFEIKDFRNPTRPLFWEPVGNADYNYRDGSGNGPGLGRWPSSSVSGDLIARSGFFGCEFEGGAWQTSGLIRVNPNKTYEFDYAAKHRTFSPVDVLHSSQIYVFDAGRNQFFDIVPNPSDPQEDTYVNHTAVTVGPDGQVPWPEGTAFVRLKVFANGLAAGPECAVGETVARVFYDNVYFRPVR